MSEVVDVREVIIEVAPPKLYKVLAICEERFCQSRFVVVAVKVFHMNHPQGFKLASRLETRGVATCLAGLSREIAETRAEQADDVLIQEVAGCNCQTDRKIKFKVEEE